MSGDQAIENLESLEQIQSVQLLENLNEPFSSNTIITANGLKIHSNLNPNAVEFYPSYLKQKHDTQAKEQIKKLIFKNIQIKVNCNEEFSRDIVCENSGLQTQNSIEKKHNDQHLFTNYETNDLKKQNFMTTACSEVKHLKSNTINSSEINQNQISTSKTETVLSRTDDAELGNKNIIKIGDHHSKITSNRNSPNETVTKQDLFIHNIEMDKQNTTKKPVTKDINILKANAMNNDLKIKPNDRIECKQRGLLANLVRKEMEHLKTNAKVNFKINAIETVEKKSKTDTVNQNLIKAVEKLKSNVKNKTKIDSIETTITTKKTENDKKSHSTPKPEIVRPTIIKTSKINPNEIIKKKTENNQQKPPPINLDAARTIIFKTASKNTEKLKSNIKTNSKIQTSTETQKSKTELKPNSFQTNLGSDVGKSSLNSIKKSSILSTNSFKNSKNITSKPANGCSTSSSTIKSVMRNPKLEMAKNKDNVSQKSLNMDKSSSSCNR